MSQSDLIYRLSKSEIRRSTELHIVMHTLNASSWEAGSRVRSQPGPQSETQSLKENVQGLERLLFLAEDLSSVPTTHVRWLKLPETLVPGD